MSDQTWSLDGVDGGSAAEPSDLYEVYRRRLQRDARELWRYLNSQLEELAKNSNVANKTLWDTRSRYHVIMSDIGEIATNNMNKKSNDASRVIKH